uniref:DDT domain-containing protein DDR4-like isoform X2 n=1 Tax=Erigeron canadensis TaxID=72917 RepID=UPI001CB8DFA7|nr:DDT domain-containing protein DDR4-like isoform X2 [Erigeron canadensis]
MNMSEEPSSPPIQCEKDNQNDNNGVFRRERPSRACTVRSAARLCAAAAAEAVAVADRRKKKSKKRVVRRQDEEDGGEEEEEQPPSPPNPYSDIVTQLVEEPPISQLERWNVRSMSELASILNFFNVFRPVLNIKVEFSVDELETALITPTDTLADIHIPLLKAIPPVTRMALGRNTWVTALCRKLKDWWHWVAEGELPIVASHGAEIESYNSLNPCIRVIILKALCDIRVEQEDIKSHIDDSIKHGIPLSSFRKERTGGDSHGVFYWYEDDQIIGQRLYREIRSVEVKKGKGKNVQSVPSYQWETVATSLDEFIDVSEKLCSSKNRTEASFGKKIINDMLPEIEKVHKRKEKLLKKQHRQALLLDSMAIDALGPGRSMRGRKPVSYTFDDYDRSINEAIRTQSTSESGLRREGLRHHDVSTNGTLAGPSQSFHQTSLSPSSPDSLNFDEIGEDHASEQLDRRKRQRPQRYSTREFVEASDMDTDDDIVGEAVYDDDYIKRRKGKKMSSASEEEEEYHLEEENAEDEEFMSSSEDSDAPPSFKRSARTRGKKLRSVGDLQTGLRRSKRANRSRIDYQQIELSESEPEIHKRAKPNVSYKYLEASDSPSFSTGSEDTTSNDDDNDATDSNNDNDDHDDINEDDNKTEVDRSTVIKEQSKKENEEPSKPENLDNRVQDDIEGRAQKRGFLDLNELAPGSGFEDGPVLKDDDTDNV